MCTDEVTTITRLDQVDEARLNEEQQAIFTELRKLAPETVRRSAIRFRRHDSGFYIATPTTLAAARSLEMALRIGLRLNCLHPDRLTAEKFLKTNMEGGVSTPTAFIFGDDCVQLFARGFEQAPEKRRYRLSKLPSDWFAESLNQTSRCGTALRGALIVIALTGCRPVELHTSMIQVQADQTTIKFLCAKAAPNNEPRARFRSFTLTTAGALGHWVRKLNAILQLLPAESPFATVSAKSIENAFNRISDSLSLPPKGKITASCYRNQFSADLKRDGISQDAVAYFMGHTSSRTAKKYGTWQQGKAGRRNYIETSKPIEHLLPPGEGLDALATMRQRDVN
jgi:integrase